MACRLCGRDSFPACACHPHRGRRLNHERRPSSPRASPRTLCTSGAASGRRCCLRTGQPTRRSLAHALILCLAHLQMEAVTGGLDGSPVVLIQGPPGEARGGGGGGGGRRAGERGETAGRDCAPTRRPPACPPGSLPSVQAPARRKPFLGCCQSSCTRRQRAPLPPPPRQTAAAATARSAPRRQTQRTFPREREWGVCVCGHARCVPCFSEAWAGVECARQGSPRPSVTSFTCQALPSRVPPHPVCMHPACTRRRAAKPPMASLWGLSSPPLPSPAADMSSTGG